MQVEPNTHSCENKERPGSGKMGRRGYQWERVDGRGSDGIPLGEDVAGSDGVAVWNGRLKGVCEGHGEVGWDDRVVPHRVDGHDVVIVGVAGDSRPHGEVEDIGWVRDLVVVDPVQPVSVRIFRRHRWLVVLADDGCKEKHPGLRLGRVTEGQGGSRIELLRVTEGHGLS